MAEKNDIGLMLEIRVTAVIYRTLHSYTPIDDPRKFSEYSSISRGTCRQNEFSTKLSKCIKLLTFFIQFVNILTSTFVHTAFAVIRNFKLCSWFCDVRIEWTVFVRISTKMFINSSLHAFPTAISCQSIIERMQLHFNYKFIKVRAYSIRESIRIIPLPAWNFTICLIIVFELTLPN